MGKISGATFSSLCAPSTRFGRPLLHFLHLGLDLPVPHVRLSQRFPRFFVRTQKLDFVNKCGRMPLVEVADGPPLATSGAPPWRPGATF